MLSKLLLTLLFIAGIDTSSAVLKQGESCGVTGEDYFAENFTGPVAVSGNGCASENNTNCLCGFDFTQEGEGPWKWQCNGAVQFGPKNGKVCPEKVPVIKRQGVDSIEFDEDATGLVACNTTVNPTGYPPDEGCDYSECETGGSYSAICGCVDVEGIGESWVCLHATCACSLTDDEGAAPAPAPASTPSAPTKPTGSPPTSTSAARSTPFIFAALVSSVVFMIAGL